MILKDYYDEMERRTGHDWDNTTVKADFLDAAQAALRRIYLDYNLNSEKDTENLTTVDGTALYRLSPRVLRGINFRETNSPGGLDFMSREDFEKDHPYPASTEEGAPNTYIPMRKVRVSAQPTASSALSIVSSSSSDTTQYVVVRGLVSGVEKTERLLLTGTTAVTSSNSYDADGVLSVSKSVTVGTVTVTSNAAAVTNISLLPAQREKEQWEVRLYPKPDAAYTIPYTFQYVPWTLTHDEESIPLPDVYIEAFKALTVADLYFKQGNEKWKDWEVKGISLMDKMEERNYFGEDEDLRFGFPEHEYDEEE